MRLSQLGVSFRHPNVRMTEDLRQFIQISAVHHVPRGERVPEIMKTEVFNFRKLKERFKAAFNALPFALCTTLRREQLLRTDRARILPKLCGQLGSHRHVPKFPALELRANSNE